jgi:hypothetical protein
MTDPLLYDRCIRRFQSAAEREADGKAKGYSGILEADLYRSEAKLAALAQETHPSPSSSSHPTSLNPSSSFPSTSTSEPLIPFVSYLRGPKGEIISEDGHEIKSKEEGFERWKFEMTVRFLRGADEEFEYGDVDESEEYDELERRESEERWFDEEEPEWDGEEGGGETGVQDF